VTARLRIALVSEHASPLATLGAVDAGGQNVYVDALARGLARRGHDVVVHTRRDDPALPPVVTMAPGVRVRHVDAGPPTQLDKDSLWPFMDRFASVLAERFRDDAPDVVHTHFWMSGDAGGRAARAVGVPWVHTYHALGAVKRRHLGDDDPSPAARLGVERAIAHETDAIVATCRDEVAELVRFAGSVAPVAIVPCGIDTSVFRPHGDAAPRRTGTRRLVSVSRLVRRKGVGDAIRALRWLPRTELVVAGGPPLERIADDPEHRRLVDVARRAGVADAVSFVGGLDRAAVARLLRSADLAVCAPAYEPFGIAPIEAMACGVPVIGTAVGGLLDTVEPGVTGSLVPPGRPDLIAAAARRLLVDDDCRSRLAAEAAARAAARYDWRRVVEQVEDAYRATIARAGETPTARSVTHPEVGRCAS
jgi:glycosyltransferase involved in cell wall biosynthesis